MEITTFAGYTVGIGAVASFLTQYVKGDWIPYKYRAIVCRLIVAAVSLGLNAGSTVLQGGTLNGETLVSTFFSYVVAAAAYDHLWKK